MEHLQYLLIFSGGDYDGWSLTDEVIDQLSERKEMFGINDFELIKSPLADLIYKYMIFQSDTELCDSCRFPQNM